MPLRRFSLLQPYGVRGDQLADELDKDERVTLKPGVDRITFYAPQEVEMPCAAGEEDVVQSIVSAHVPQALYFDRDYSNRQRDLIDAMARELLTGLGKIENVADFGYAYTARLLAKAAGATPSEILAIMDQATAQAYITSMSEWGALPVAVRQWLAVDLVSRAYNAVVVRLLMVD